MSRVRETLQQQAGHQLPQGAGVHASKGKKSKKGNPSHKRK